jgi:hypothetical protein
MGTTFQAQVEVFFPATPECQGRFGHPAFWQGVSRWELQKDYEFSMAWTTVAKRGWPINHSNIIGAQESGKLLALLFEGKYWGDGQTLGTLSFEDEGVWFCELRSHVLSLIGRGYEVRVLTWDE